MALSEGYAKFVIGDKIKTSPGHHIQELIFKAYTLDRRLCVHTLLKAYLERTLSFRSKETKFFLYLKAPHKSVSSDAIERWVRDTMSNAGTDLRLFQPHSTS